MHSMNVVLLGAAFLWGCKGSAAQDDQNGTGALADPQVTVVLETTIGDVVLELDTVRAPITATNFLRYVDGGHYDGASFYRAVRMDNQPTEPFIEVVQGGVGLTVYADGGTGPTFPPIEHEGTDQTGLRHRDGAISMGRLAVGTASSEFFICINDQPSLDFGGDRNPDGQGFAAFGRVVRGMDVVRKIQRAATGANVPEQWAALAGQILSEPIQITRASRR